MKHKQIFFFATVKDLIELIKFIESNFNIVYAQAGLLDEIGPKIFSLLAIEDWKYLQYGDWNFNKIYIVIPKEKNLHIREVPQKSGGMKYAIDQMLNEESIEISVGGNYKGTAIISSKITTISKTEFANHIMKTILIYFNKHSDKIQEFYICPDAKNEAKNGLRLTTDIKSSTNFDILV